MMRATLASDQHTVNAGQALQLSALKFQNRIRTFISGFMSFYLLRKFQELRHILQASSAFWFIEKGMQSSSSPKTSYYLKVPKKTSIRFTLSQLCLTISVTFGCENSQAYQFCQENWILISWTKNPEKASAFSHVDN